MKSGSRFLGVFDGLIDRLLCVLGAVLLSQGPEFMQQYLQRLGGHLNESQRQLVSYQDAANKVGLPLSKFIEQTEANPDAGVSHLGKVMSSAAHRSASLQAAHDALRNASPWARPFAFMRHVDVDIARNTWSAYKPAVPVTVEGLLYALFGMLLFLLIYHGAVKGPIRLYRGKPKPAPAG